ncbi:hypothetical protein MYXO_01865 [Myxococcaceae bacterium]|nr:hypothetical protein MYXO_01865 [Myxococcaceae bacterium]
MKTTELRLVTILAEPELATRLVDEIRALGARGYSLVEGRAEWQRGRGDHGPSDWNGPNVRIDTVVRSEVSDAILEHLASTYFEHYAVFAYVSTVFVARPDRYR